MKKIIFFLVLSLFSISANVGRAQTTLPQPDSLIKGESSTVYYYAADGFRYVFPNDKTFGSWFSDFNMVTTVSADVLSKIPLKGNITYRPGVRMVKVQTVSKVYVVDEGGELRWIENEELAKKLYGDDWNKKIDDIPDGFFVNYKEGASIKKVEDYSPSTTVEEVKTINKDRGITESASAPQATTSVGSSTTPTTPAEPNKDSGSAIPAIPAQPTNKATSTPEAPTSTPSGTIPATPATPGAGGTPTTPATPATPPQGISLPDTRPPVIDNVQATNITETSATITWATNELSSSVVSYDLSSPPSTTTSTIKVTGANNVTNHSVNLTALSSSKTHYYVVVSTDGNNNTASSSEQSFTTLTPSPPMSNWNNNSLNVGGGSQSVVWNGNGYGSIYGLDGKLYFIKLDSSGNKLSETIIATVPNYVQGTSIVWDGLKYGIAWVQANPGNMRFATVDIDGKVLSNIAVTVDDDNTFSQNPALLWDGSSYVLSWWGESLSGGPIYFAKIDLDGHNFIVNKKKAVVTAKAYGHDSIVSINTDGQNFGVAWSDVRDSGNLNLREIYFSMLDSNGNPLIPDIKLSGSGLTTDSPNIVFDGSNYIVVWHETGVENGDINLDSNIHMAKISPAGIKLISDKKLTETPIHSGYNSSPKVIRNNDGFDMTWAFSEELGVGASSFHPGSGLVYFKSFDFNGEAINDVELVSIITGDNYNPNLGSSGFKYGIIWENMQNNQSQLYFGTK